MKRLLIPFAAFIVFCIMSASCNNYTCPAYADKAEQPEQEVDQNS